MPMSQRAVRSSRRKPGEKDFTKRRTVDEGLALSDAAHAAVWRLYCEVFEVLALLPRQEVSPPSALPRRAGAVPDARSFLGAGGGAAGGGRGSDRRRAAAHGAVDAHGMAAAPRAAAAGDGVAEVVLISRVPRPASFAQRKPLARLRKSCAAEA